VLTRQAWKLRTPHGQRRRLTRLRKKFPQLNAYSGGVGSAPCKTVGLAYVGSNPTPATTCVNSRLTANSRVSGLSFSVPRCVTLSRCRPLCCGVHGRIACQLRPNRDPAVPGLVAAEEPLDLQMNHGLLGRHCRIAQPPLIPAMDPAGRRAAGWARGLQRLGAGPDANRSAG
jgi:hypothetical protein